MKALIFIAAAFCLLYAETGVEWISKTEQELGDITHRQPVTIDFQFRNTGQEPILVDNVRTSCGCTVPEWSADPVLPDSTGIISVEYDARDVGYFHKKIKVFFSHQRKAELLFIEGYVLE